jgi:glycosyltransferase involved in cell wall biosynthesis
MNVLFITWDGPQVTYLESLFLPIFARLAAHDIHFHVLQFTWGGAERIALTRQECERLRVGYQAFPIWRRPRAIGAMLSALLGARHVKKAVRAHHIDVVMPRSTLPALATLFAVRGTPCRMVFDADGLPLDERVDFAGQAPTSFVHRILRDVEAQAVRRADLVLTRSTKATGILHARAGAGTALDKFHLVNNGRDADLFKPADPAHIARMRRELGLPVGVPMLVYAGSLGAQYCLEAMVRLFALVRERRPDAHWLILTGSPEAVQPILDHYPRLQGGVSTRNVSPQSVAQYLACADLGLSLRQPSFSMQGVAPIKLGEYLLCGVPVLATAGIGDSDAITSKEGCLLRSMDEAALQAAANWFVDTVLPARAAYRASCRAVGLNRFSLEASADLYRNAFESLKENS